VSQGTVTGEFKSGVTGRNAYWPAEERVELYTRAIALRPDHRMVRHFYVQLGVAQVSFGRRADCER
jgi:hypothetical protein